MLSKRYKPITLECGTDEAGRGCLAGPVTAAAIILPETFQSTLLNDSKQVSEKNRFKLMKRFIFCGPTWARTKDHLIMSQVL